VTRRIEALSSQTPEAVAIPLAALHRTCFPEDPWQPQAIAELMALAGFFGRIAWEGLETTGLALAQGLSQECEILTLGVVPKWRRSGIASALLAAIVEEARHRGAQALFLEVAVDNTAARALYRVNGFVQIGRRANYYRRAECRVDALVLRHLLST